MFGGVYVVVNMSVGVFSFVKLMLDDIEEGGLLVEDDDF